MLKEFVTYAQISPAQRLFIDAARPRADVHSTFCVLGDAAIPVDLASIAERFR